MRCCFYDFGHAAVGRLVVSVVEEIKVELRWFAGGRDEAAEYCTELVPAFYKTGTAPPCGVVLSFHDMGAVVSPSNPYPPPP